MVARLSVEGAEFWVGAESPEHFNFSPQSLGGSSVRIIFTVADPDAVFAKAIKAGASQVLPRSRQEHGWRLGRVVDPFEPPLGNRPSARRGIKLTGCPQARSCPSLYQCEATVTELIK